MTQVDRPQRADARRNRETILRAAGELFAERGASAALDEIAERSGLGMGTLYRHFPTKQALLDAIVAARFVRITELARAAARIDDPAEAFRTLVRTYLEEAEQDAGYRRAVLGPDRPDWGGLAAEKGEWVAVAGPIIAAAVAAGTLPADFGVHDFILITRGVMANMSPGGDWRRHLQLFHLLASGSRPPAL